ncbi:MAG: tetratricopeptide repeat protein [Smithella sp.]|jgi:tetratricopeptide (TPR) repeat protein|nr:tetratricopeptide repeat protein [Smithella sp.]
MAARMSKKELKSPDAFQSTFERLGDYVAENKTRVTVVGTALLCAILIAAGIYFYWSHYSNSALKLYAKAQGNIIAGGETKEVLEENARIFDQLIKKYPHSWSGRLAYYHLGNIEYNNGEYDLAISCYEKFVRKAGSDKTGVKFLALSSMGYAYEAKKDFDGALKCFEKAQKEGKTGFETLGLQNIARAYEELDNKEKALEYYKKALEKTTDPSAGISLKRKIATLS